MKLSESRCAEMVILRCPDCFDWVRVGIVRTCSVFPKKPFSVLNYSDRLEVTVIASKCPQFKLNMSVL